MLLRIVPTASATSPISSFDMRASARRHRRHLDGQVAVGDALERLAQVRVVQCSRSVSMRLRIRLTVPVILRANHSAIAKPASRG